MLNVLDPAPTAPSQVNRFDDLFRHFYPRLIPLAERLLGDRAEAEDMLQEAFLRLARSGRGASSDATETNGEHGQASGDGDSVLGQPDAVIGVWLRRVVLNLSANRLRDRRRAAARDERAGRLDSALDSAHGLSDQTSPSSELMRAETRAEVRAALVSLPERQRNCLLLRHAGHSYAEIAATLGLAIGSVGVYLARAERAFRAAYETQNQEHGLDNEPGMRS